MPFFVNASQFLFLYIFDFPLSLLGVFCLLFAYYRIFVLIKKKSEEEVYDESVMSSLSLHINDDYIPESSSKMEYIANFIAFIVFYASIATAADFLSTWSSHLAKETFKL